MYTQHIILDFEMNPVSCSTKKSGEYQIVQEIIEIGAVRLDRDFNEKDHFQCMVKPFYSAEIADRIKKLTGITTRETVQKLIPAICTHPLHACFRPDSVDVGPLRLLHPV